jgi:methylated-DNA-[protein]-cysteine S-methyltransferase
MQNIEDVTKGGIGYYNSPLGKIEIIEIDNMIHSIAFCSVDPPRNRNAISSELTESAIIQLDEYFSNKRREFELPLFPAPSHFQTKVRNALLCVPYGQTRSYKDIAFSIGLPNCARAVGRANHLNPIAIVVPCHRIIGHNQKLVGYAYGLDTKLKLLELERNLSN